MRKIIIPTDFSSPAWNALLLAVRMFKYDICEVHILHTFSAGLYDDDSLITSDSSESIKDRFNRESSEKVLKIIKKIEKNSANPRHKFFYKIKLGTLVDEINDLSKQENIDLVIMGTKGKSDDRKKTIGSNTLAVIKFINAPVLCVPANYEFKDLENILFPTNYLLPYQKRELELVKELVKKFTAHIHFLYVSKFPPELKRQKANEQEIKEIFHSTISSFRYQDDAPINEVISQLIEEVKADLLVMVNSEHTYLSNILYKSTIDNFTLSGKIPLLVLQNMPRNN